MNENKLTTDKTKLLVQYMNSVDELKIDHLKCKLVSDYMF